MPRVKNRQKRDFLTFRNINSIFSKTVKDRKIIDPIFYSQWNCEPNGVAENSPGRVFYPNKEARIRNFDKKSGPQSKKDGKVAPRVPQKHF